MIKCKNCGCRLYDDFGLGLYNYETGSAECPLTETQFGDHVKISERFEYPHEDDTVTALASNMLSQVLDQQEAFLIQHFGSRERAIAEAHLYVLEDHGTKVELGQEYTLSSTWTLRLRKKTPEELAADSISQE